MYESEVFRQELTSLQALLNETGNSLNIEHLKEQLIEYQEDMASPGFWDDIERAQKINQRASSCENRINHYKSLCTRIEDIDVMMELAEEPHLHFEMMVGGQAVDPLAYLSEESLSASLTFDEEVYED